MSIDCIELYTPDGHLISRRINGVEQHLTDIEMEQVPFVFTKQVITREEYEKVWGKKKKHK